MICTKFSLKQLRRAFHSMTQNVSEIGTRTNDFTSSAIELYTPSTKGANSLPSPDDISIMNYSK
jgi:hypothetical protein